MNYAKAMQYLTKYREDKKNIERSFTKAYQYIESLKSKRAIADGLNDRNIVEQIRYLLDQYDGKASRLGDNVKYGCDLLNIKYTEQMRAETSAYESKLLEIQSNVRDELKKGVNKPLTGSFLKLFGVLMLGLLAASALFTGLALSMPKITMVGIGLGLLDVIIAIKKNKPDEAVLSALVSKAQSITKNYFSELLLTFEKAYADAEVRRDSTLSDVAEEAKAIVGERVLFLFENTPYDQQDYFIKLGMTATSEDDFNSIAKECIIADKTQQQINIQNMINIETRNSINQKLDDLNRTTKKMHEDAEFRAKQQASHNAELAKQNERNLENQRKTLDEMKKTGERVDEFEYRMRHK